MNDKYGSKVREENKQVMEYPARPRTPMTMERRVRKIRRWWYNVTDSEPTTFVVGWLVIGLVLAVAVAQIAIKYGWRP